MRLPRPGVKYNLFFIYFNLVSLLVPGANAPLHTALIILHIFFLLSLGSVRKRIYLFYKLRRWQWNSIRFHGDTVSAKTAYGTGRTTWYADRLYEYARGRTSPIGAGGWTE